MAEWHSGYWREQKTWCCLTAKRPGVARQWTQLTLDKPLDFVFSFIFLPKSEVVCSGLWLLVQTEQVPGCECGVAPLSEAAWALGRADACSLTGPGSGAAAPPRPSAPSPVRTHQPLGRCPSRLRVSGPRAQGSLALDQAPEVGRQLSLPGVPPACSLANTPSLAREMSGVHLAGQCSVSKAESA